MVLILIAVNCFAQKTSIKKEKLDSLIEKSKESKSDAFIIYENDKLIVEEYDGVGHRDSLIQPWSCTKSIVGLAFIALLDDGLLDSLDLPVYALYPEWNQGQKKDITVRHLLTMSSGLQCAPRMHAEVYPSPDCIQLALSASIIETPGTVWRYNNKGFNLLADIVRKLSGQPMDAYIKERLFKPLDIMKVKWDVDQNKTPYAFLGSHLRPIDFAKLGLLIANKGNYNGKRILSEANIIKLNQPSQARENYGLGCWISCHDENNPDPYTFVKKVRLIGAMGSYGNYIFIIPEKNIVVVRLISYKTYGSSEDPYDLTEDQYGPTAFPDLRSMIYELVE